MTKELLIVTGPSYKEARDQIKLAQTNYQGVELRVDLFEVILLDEIEKLVNLNNRKTMITLRSKKAGGQYKGSFKEQKKLILSMLAINIDYIDIEDSLCSEFSSDKIICSFHSFHQGVENIDKLYRKLTRHKALNIKMCLKSSNENQAKRYLNFLEHKVKKKSSITLLSPNKEGLITRHYGPLIGNAFNYTPTNSKNKLALNAIFT